MTPETPRIEAWTLNPAARWLWRDWGGDSVVIEVLSGRTLQFDPFSAAVMACIESGARDIDGLRRMMAQDIGTGAEDQWIESLWTVLQQLAKLGWIEPLDP
jgi:hypothetical protein